MVISKTLKKVGLHRRNKPILDTPKKLYERIKESKYFNGWEKKLASSRGSDYARGYETEEVKEMLKAQVKRAYNQDPYGIRGSVFSKIDESLTNTQYKGAEDDALRVIFSGEEEVGINPFRMLANIFSRPILAAGKTIAATGEFIYGFKKPSDYKGHLRRVLEIPLSAASAVYSGIDSTEARSTQKEAENKIVKYMNEALDSYINNVVGSDKKLGKTRNPSNFKNLESTVKQKIKGKDLEDTVAQAA
jgi:hypothetical protein